MVTIHSSHVILRSCRPTVAGILLPVIVTVGLSVVTIGLALQSSIATAAEPRATGEPQGPTAGARVIPCALASPVTSLMRRSALERRWEQIEKELEQPLRALLAGELMSQEALASLDQRVLGLHRWTLTRYLVRVLRELEAADLVTADRLLRLDAYAEHALRDAMWDGKNGWDVVSTVRAETLQILATLERESQARSRVERLLEAAAEPEPYFVGSNCEQPRD